MNTYKYKPYYQYNGPTLGEPLKEKLSEEDQERNLRLICDDIKNAFADDDEAVVTEDSDGIISITTSIARKECDDIVAGCLTGLDLYGHKL